MANITLDNRDYRAECSLRSTNLGGVDDYQVTISADVMPANVLEIARRLEAHAQGARGALADQTCRALAALVGLVCEAERIAPPCRAGRRRCIRRCPGRNQEHCPALHRHHRHHRPYAPCCRTRGCLVRAKGSRQRRAAPLGELAAETILATQPKTLSGLRNVA